MPIKIQTHEDLLQFIRLLRETDRYIETIYLNGACYRFHLLLNQFLEGARPKITRDKKHIVTYWNGKHFDITGEVTHTFLQPTPSEIRVAEAWSFHKTKALQIGECPYCEEPIIV